MAPWNRRQFLARSGAGLGTALAAASPAVGQSATPIDFRYAPLSGQTAFCFPDDPFKSLVGERGELRYGFARGHFETVIAFSVTGVEPDVVARQELESPAVPIVHTRIYRAEAFLHLIAFATNRASEGRVDNVIVEIRPRTRRTVRGAPVVTVRSRRAVRSQGNAVYLDGDGGALLFASDQPCLGPSDAGVEWVLRGKLGPARAGEPLRQFFRFPQEGQALEKIAAGLAEPDALLAEAREFWRAWRPFGGPVSWRVPGSYGEFLTAPARNILQARARNNGRLTFQVGPTVYRGLWVVDGNFILEAARYLGYDAEAQQGLETAWALQEKDGGIFAGAGREHWKDTGIAMFTLVRQAELSQDWTYFRRMQPNVMRGVEFLRGLCAKAAAEGSASGRYGLFPKGMGDGGLGGLRDEFTNTIWVLAGLQAVEQAAARLRLSEFEPVARFYRQLHAAFFSRGPAGDAPPLGGLRLPAHVDEERSAMERGRSMGPPAAASRAVGDVARDLSRPGVRERRPSGEGPHRADAGVHPGRHAGRNRMAAARGHVELCCRVRCPRVPLGGIGGLGADYLYRLPEPCHAALLLARGATAPRS